MVIVKYSDGKIDKIVKSSEEIEDELNKKIVEAKDEIDLNKEANQSPFWTK